MNGWGAFKAWHWLSFAAAFIDSGRGECLLSLPQIACAVLELDVLTGFKRSQKPNARMGYDESIAGCYPLLVTLLSILYHYQRRSFRIWAATPNSVGFTCARQL